MRKLTSWFWAEVGALLSRPRPPEAPTESPSSSNSTDPSSNTSGRNYSGLSSKPSDIGQETQKEGRSSERSTKC